MTVTVVRDGAVVILDDVTAAEFEASRAPPSPSTAPTDYPLLPWQFKVMVDVLGKDEQLRTEIGAIPDEWQRAVALNRYLHATSYEWSDPLMQSMREAIGMSIEEMSDAWMIAKDLTSRA